VTGCPTFTVISAGSILSASVSVTSILCAAALAAGDDEAGGADGEAVEPALEHAETMSTSAEPMMRCGGRMILLGGDCIVASG
jgi:hypothetical protein